jgi:hypothetical protein
MTVFLENTSLENTSLEKSQGNVNARELVDKFVKFRNI